MTRAKVLIVAVLLLAPVAFLVGAGMYFLWDRGWSFYAWWPMAGCLAIAYALAAWWTRQARVTLDPAAATVDLPNYWTDRDRTAWKKATEFIGKQPPLVIDQADNLKQYGEVAQSLAMTVADVYRPGTTDPFGHLTIPELLTCTELVSQDLHRLVDQYVPGSHLVRINDIKLARRAVDWYKTGQTAYWVAAAVMNPIQTALQFTASRVGIQSPLQQLQDSLIAWLYTTYQHELARYLIELNSGRLKVGAARYRELLAMHRDPAEAAKTGDTAMSPATVLPIRIAVVGQVKAGKSSLINALLGERRADVAVTPLTDKATSYELREADLPPLILTDTPGYGTAGLTDAERNAAHEAATFADLILLVCHARTASRKADVDMLAALRSAIPVRDRVPPILVVMTHIDLLTPAAEWSPPYEWKQGQRPKEVSMREATTAIRDVLPGPLADLIPVCTADGKVTGVREELSPAIAALLGEARGVSFLRTLRLEADANPAGKVVGQIWSAGKEAISRWLKPGEGK